MISESLGHELEGRGSFFCAPGMLQVFMALAGKVFVLSSDFVSPPPSAFDGLREYGKITTIFQPQFPVCNMGIIPTYLNREVVDYQGDVLVHKDTQVY